MSNRAKTLFLLLGDSLCLILALIGALSIRKLGLPTLDNLARHAELFSYIFALWLFIYFIEGLYSLKTYNPANLPISIIRSTSLSLALSYTAIYLMPSRLTEITPKTNLIICAALSLVFLFLWRRWFYQFFSNQRRNLGVLLIGSETTVNLVQKELARKPHLGYRIVEVMNEQQALQSKLRSHIDLIAIERRSTKNPVLLGQVFNLLGQVEIIDLAKFAERISGKIPITSIDESWFIEYCGHQESRSYDLLKLIGDKFIAIMLLIALIPIATLLLPFLLIFHGRPLFFKQIRTGQNNKPFKLYKLRTMVVDAEKDGAQWAQPKDARVTSIGKVLRKTRLDELPQLINIIRGEMSLVGPRPERPEIIKSQLQPVIPFYNLRHLVKPGVTGWAQVTFRYGFSTEDSLQKLQYDLFYVKNKSLWLDILIFLKTIKTVLTGAGQ